MNSNFQDLFQKIANQKGLSRQLDAAQICQRYRRLAPQIIAPDILKYTTPRSFKNNTLYISTQNSAWSQEVHMNKIDLLEALNKDSKSCQIRDIKTVVE